MSSEQFINELSQAITKVGSLHAVGETWVSVTGVPAGGLPFDGASVSKTIYADLFAWAKKHNLVKPISEWDKLHQSQNGNVPFYGDEGSTFKVPKITAYLKVDSTPGTYIAEGLPNITGEFTPWAWKDLNPPYSVIEGAFLTDGTNNRSSYSAGDSKNGLNITFDASRCSPIFGRSEHVTPETLTVQIGVYAHTVVKQQAGVEPSAVLEEATRLLNEAKTLNNADKYVRKAGANGKLAIYGEVTKGDWTTLNLNHESFDNIVWETSGNVTLTCTSAPEDTVATKVIYLKAKSATTLTVNGARWSGGSAPTWGTEGKRMTLVAYFVMGEVLLVVSDNEEG